ncbi:arabinan endo-1,5-alpha-L-arabinosidase [Galbibacter sp. EGI 63066]|uniref:arabinan endo-1,5-alpha-L-arabinosidase n=1 Tax=Galbibacter sp. EGI 63066 TaxID=2993559 RepID=UPI0022496C66|nr:arabinan endo-1,5-alpha-L-arabinosidase [Galbibacter sp. EGI 63066]MCX2680468.1 arabinan endo-1,5-alpha-L-arabinosidase [Galbibacter sp. EGI 63066]
MKRFLITYIFLFCAIYSFAQDKPIVHDPVVIQQDDTYYLFCTGKGIASYTSKDLINWEKAPAIFAEKPKWTDKVVPDFNNHIWAPDVAFHNGKYYVYYSVSAFAKNTSAIGLVTNATLNPKDENYKWEDHGIVIQSVPNRDLWNAIDPNLIFDEEDTPWLAFGSFWDGLKMVKLTSDLKSVAEPQEWHTIARRERDFELDDKDPGNAALEAPFIFKKDGYYYQFLSWDLCCRREKSTYKVVVGRSETATGPYVDKEGKELNQGGGTLVIEGNENWYGIGHNSVYHFNLPTGQAGGKDYYFSHAYDANDKGAPKLIVKEITWVDGWPTVKPLD